VLFCKCVLKQFVEVLRSNVPFNGNIYEYWCSNGNDCEGYCLLWCDAMQVGSWVCFRRTLPPSSGHKISINMPECLIVVPRWQCSACWLC
jgi:hypothetical protein